eukprot:764331-Hanusia_phi.AAC.1
MPPSIGQSTGSTWADGIRYTKSSYRTLFVPLEISTLQAPGRYEGGTTKLSCSSPLTTPSLTLVGLDETDLTVKVTARPACSAVHCDEAHGNMKFSIKMLALED